MQRDGPGLSCKRTTSAKLEAESEKKLPEPPNGRHMRQCKEVARKGVDENLENSPEVQSLENATDSGLRHPLTIKDQPYQSTNSLPLPVTSKMQSVAASSVPQVGRQGSHLKEAGKGQLD